ncbi:MAG: hypothetical protein KDD53_07505, partial [Bdellovibrionales bacterium]|nr:hypothetical protein [Bdellovibrionales bacterium]
GVVISMIESQAPESSDDRLRQIEEKFNSYLGYILDGYFVAEYPQYKGRNITIRFETSYPIEEPALEMFLAMLQFSKSQGLEFEVLDHTGPINLSGTENEN